MIEAAGAATIVVVSKFPVYHFVIETNIGIDDAIRILDDEFRSARRSTWPMPDAKLVGAISGGDFRCRPRTAAFGGNATPSVVGKIEAGSSGRALVRVRVYDWFSLFLPGVFVALGVYLVLKSASSVEFFKALAIIAWVLLAGIGMYWAEVAFVRRIFKRVFFPSAA